MAPKRGENRPMPIQGGREAVYRNGLDGGPDATRGLNDKKNCFGGKHLFDVGHLGYCAARRSGVVDEQWRCTTFIMDAHGRENLR